MEDFVTEDSKLTSSAAQPTVTKLQSRKKTAQSQVKNKEAEELASQPICFISPNKKTDTPDQKI